MKHVDTSEIRARLYPKRVTSKYGTWLQWHFVITQGTKVLVYDDCRDFKRAFASASWRVSAFREAVQSGHEFRDYRELVDEASI